MKWYAIKGPDGTLYTDTADPCRWGAWGIAEGIVRDFPVGRSNSGEAVKKRGERAGYRCVEVNIVEAARTGEDKEQA